MQQPHPDQQIQPQIQYTTPQYQQLQQPIMLCPVQYVYEPLLPDEQGQSTPTEPYQSQAFLLNVQNTPPWAQNRHNMIYMQHMPSNIQPYIPQQMVQNPMYNYQYQPMIVQEQIRQIVPSYVNQSVMHNQQIIQNVMNQQMMQNVAQNQQIMQSVAQNQQAMQNSAQNQQLIQNVAQNPQLMQNVAQNQVVSQNPTVMNSNIIQNPIRFQMEKRETPILASMLNVRKPPQQNELVSLIRPQYQNVRPQMIIVNPLAKHTCVHNTPSKEPAPSSIPIEKQLKNDIQSIRNQVPEGLSVKTIKAPVTALVKPNENVFQNIAPADDIHPRVNAKPKQQYNRNPQTNYKRKIRELLELNNKDGNEVLAKRSCPVNKPDEQLFKVQVPPNDSESQINNISTLPMVNTQTMNVKPQVEEKKLRNTVYVQARGRVDDLRLNEIRNVNYTNASSIETSIENVINNKNNENLNVMVNNATLELNRTNNEHLNSSAVNNVSVMHNNIMNLNNQSVETNIESEMNVNEIGNLDVPMPTENEAEANLDNQIVSEEMVQNVNDTLTEENISKDKEIVQDNNKQIEAKLTQIIPANSGISTEHSSTTIKLLSNESTTRKSKNTKVLETDMTQNKSAITNVSQADKTLLSNDSNDLQSKSTMTLISKLAKISEEDDSVNKSIMTEMSLTKITTPSDANQDKPDVTNINISDDAQINALLNNPKIEKDADVSEKKEVKPKVTRIEKLRKDKKKMVNTNVFVKEPVVQYVLTHVLDGHIIQESNVPFVVQKPSLLPAKEKPILREDRVEINEKTEENTIKESLSVETEASSNSETDKETRENRNESEKYDNPDTSTDDALREVEMETKGVDEDNPFKDLNKDIVVAWTISDVTSHLMKYASWRDTALKLAEQEIDGESLLLVRRDQLLRIDICDEQAQEICEFVVKLQ